MADTERKPSGIWFIIMQCLGFLGLCLPNLLHLSWGEGVCTVIWILAFLYLTEQFRAGREKWITFGVFLAGYFLRYFGTVGFEWIYLILFLAMGLIQFGIFYGYSHLLHRFNRVISTLAFPFLWMLVYLLATWARFPSLIRVDTMVADMNVLLQTESLLGSFGLSSVLLWILALLSFATVNRKPWPAAISMVLFCAMLLYGTVYLYPNVNETEQIWVAFSSGPYVGDYMNYTSLPLERYIDSMEACVANAVSQKADIIVFNEETYEIDDTDEEGFLERCCLSARENSIHMLVGLDVRDTDGSEGGKSQNKVVWIDQTGQILGSYLKTKTIPFLEDDYVRGDGVIPSHVIEVKGRQLKISYLICYDSNFPLYVRQMDRDTDILFLPSWDWPAVTQQHAKLCRALAVANRVSIVKPTYDGINIAVRSDGTVISTFDIKDLGYEQVRIMKVPLKEIGELSASANEKDHYIYSIISVEIMSILICLILLYSNIVKSSQKTARNRLFSLATIACGLALAADAFSWILDGCARLGSLLYGSTVVSLAMTFVLNGIFIFYITEYIRERAEVSFLIPRIFMGFSIVMIVLILVTAKTGLLFSFEMGVYQEGPLYTGYVIANLLCSVFCLWTNLAHMRFLDVKDRIASMSFIIFPLVAGFINVFEESFSYAYPAIVLSLIMMYIMLQSERQDQLEKEGVISYFHARHDVLTGLFNRLAYEERLQKLSASEGKSGAVFTDMNILKLTNDKYGHEAGDRLLVGYSELLCRYFRKEDVFRISGDEFTVLLENIEEEVLRSRMEEFRLALDDDGIPRASIGFAYGSSSEIGELIKQAETEMYADKAEFHSRHPELAKR